MSEEAPVLNNTTTTEEVPVKVRGKKEPKEEDPSFKKYTSIENHYEQEYIQQILEDPGYSDSIPFVALEKVHGSNFQFIVRQKVPSAQIVDKEEEIEVKVAKRTAIVPPEDTVFFPYAREPIRAKYGPLSVKLFQLIKQKWIKEESQVEAEAQEQGQQEAQAETSATSTTTRKPTLLSTNLKKKGMLGWAEIHQISVFGELFGGTYPHKEVKREHNFLEIQKQVAYYPGFEYYAFDIYVIGKIFTREQPQQKKIDVTDYHTWVPYKEACELFDQAGFKIYAKPVKTGSLRELLTLNPTFRTTITETFFPELPALPIGDDLTIAEGYVIKPYDRNIYSRTARVVIKFKNEKFSERGVKTKEKKSKKVNTTQTKRFKSEKGEEAWSEMKQYVTEQRLSNVQSKIGLITEQKQLGKLTGMMAKDALEDFTKDFKELWSGMEKEDQKACTNLLQKKTSALVASWFEKQSK